MTNFITYKYFPYSVIKTLSCKFQYGMWITFSLFKNKLKQYQLFLRWILSNILFQCAIYCKVNSFQLNVNQMKHILDNAQMVNNTISLGKHVAP